MATHWYNGAATLFPRRHHALPQTNTRRLYRVFPLLTLWLAVLATAGCTGISTISPHSRAGAAHTSWWSPTPPADRRLLDEWWAGVGPPVVRNTASNAHVADAIRLISWNTALGSGDVLQLLSEIRQSDPDTPVVLLLQEVHRGGPDVPTRSPGNMRFAGRLGSAKARLEVEAVADKAGLNLYYVPSMRNGGPLDSDEDRGNAILSSLPLEDLTAVELPFERQRRVAVAATVAGRTRRGEPFRLRVVSSHLDNLVGPSRGWILGGEFGRLRQARALLHVVEHDEAVVLGGDFNTWFGFAEPTYREIARRFPDSDQRDRRATFGGLLRLDHVFLRLPDGWSGRIHRGRTTYGSDHYPLVGRLEIGPPAGGA